MVDCPLRYACNVSNVLVKTPNGYDMRKVISHPMGVLKSRSILIDHPRNELSSNLSLGGHLVIDFPKFDTISSKINCVIDDVDFEEIGDTELCGLARPWNRRSKIEICTIPLLGIDLACLVSFCFSGRLLIFRQSRTRTRAESKRTQTIQNVGFR